MYKFKLRLYLVGEQNKYIDACGNEKTETIIYRKGRQCLEAAYIRAIPNSELVRVAKEHDVNIYEATKYFVNQNCMWLNKQCAKKFIERHASEEHQLFLIAVKD